MQTSPQGNAISVFPGGIRLYQQVLMYADKSECTLIFHHFLIPAFLLHVVIWIDGMLGAVIEHIAVFRKHRDGGDPIVQIVAVAVQHVLYILFVPIIQHPSRRAGIGALQGLRQLRVHKQRIGDLFQ